MSRDEHLLDFSAAMRDFAIMFPTASANRIEEVLRQHDGDVASTIDTLLRETQPSLAPPSYEEAVSVPSQSPVRQPELPPFSPRRSVPTPVSAPPNYSRTFFPSEPNTSNAAPIRRRESRSSLNTFNTRQLQNLKRENERRLEHVTDEKEARLLEDEQMALLLQQREMVRSARSASVAAVPTRTRSSSKHNGPRVPEGPVMDEVIISNDGQDLKDKIKKLSKASRQRLIQFTQRFRSGSRENVCG